MKVTRKAGIEKHRRRGRPRAQEVDLRWQRILEIASGVFLRDGYAGASMAKIAREAGVSKKTIYTKYKDKADLAAEVLEHLFQKSWEQVALVAKDEQRGLAPILLDFATTVCQDITSRAGAGLYRILIAENQNAKQLSRLYWRVRTTHWDDPVSKVLRSFMDKGELRPADPIQLARTFYQLSVSDLRERALLGGMISKAEIRKTAAMAVEVLLAAYAANKPA